MPVFACKRCGYSTNYKHCLVSHLVRKKECPTNLGVYERELLVKEIVDANYMAPLVEQKEEKENEPQSAIKSTIIPKIWKCQTCQKEFEYSSNCKRHERSCKKDQKASETSVKTIADQMHEIMEKFHVLEAKLAVAERPTTTINIGTLNTTLPSLRPFGKESLDHITRDELNRHAWNMYNGITNLVKRVHFDIEKPENMNVRLKSLKRKAIEVFEGVQQDDGNFDGRWVEHDADWVMEKMVATKKNMLIGRIMEIKMDPNEIEENRTRADYVYTTLQLLGNKTKEFYCVKREIFALVNDNRCLSNNDSATLSLSHNSVN